MNRNKYICIMLLLTLASIGFAQQPERRSEAARDQAADRSRGERDRDAEKPSIDWEAKYHEFLREDPSVAKAVESGRISKEKVMAGMKARWAEAKEAKLKALYERMKREDPGWARVTFEQARQRLEFMLREEAAAKGDPWEAKFQVFLRQNPALREQFIHGLKKENIIRLLKHGDAKLDERDKAAQQARSEKALKAALKIMTDAKKLNDKQASELYEIVFPSKTDWDAKYAAFLKENPGVARAVESGKISKEKVIAGIMSREGERPPTEEEQLEALYQRLLREDRTLGRTPKAALMPRLKAMLARGEGKNLRPEKSMRQRRMTFGLYFNGLIESGQVERFDQDLKRVYDIGSSEIVRQDRSKERSDFHP